MSEHLALIYPPEQFDCKNVMVDSIPELAEVHFPPVATTLDHASKNILQCRVIKPTAQDIVLPKDTPIASISPLPDATSIFKSEMNAEDTTAESKDLEIVEPGTLRNRFLSPSPPKNLKLLKLHKNNVKDLT